MTDLVGWLSSLILFVTLITQMRKQWKDKSNAGVSKWLWIGQFISSTGFIVYSVQLGNWVFVVTNSFLWMSELVGIGILIRNRKPSSP